MSDQAQTYSVSSLPAEGTAEYKTLIQAIIAEFRARGGRVGGPLAGLPLLLLTTTGARTGRPRTNPVTYLVDDGQLVFTAAKEGDATKHPDWFSNLRVNPEVTVELGTETFPARATVLEGAERQRLFDRIAAHLPPELRAELVARGVWPLVTPLGGSWLNLAESVQRILVRRALEGQHPTSAAEVMTWLSAQVAGGNADPTPFEWGGKRAARRQRAQERRHRLGGSGGDTRRPIRRRLGRASRSLRIGTPHVK